MFSTNNKDFPLLANMCFSIYMSSDKKKFPEMKNVLLQVKNINIVVGLYKNKNIKTINKITIKISLLNL